MKRSMLLAVVLATAAFGLAPLSGAASQIQADENEAAGPLDLPAIVPRPEDVPGGDYALATSESRTLIGYAGFLDVIGGETDELAEALEEAGWRQWYWVRMGVPDEDDPDLYGRIVNVYLAEYVDEDGAEIGYELLTEANEAIGYEETRGGDDVGDETVFTRRTGEVVDTGDPYAELSIVFRKDSIVVEIAIIDFSGDAPAASEAVRLGEAIEERFEAVREDGSAGFGPAVLRLDGAEATIGRDWYRRLGDETGRSYFETDAAFEADDAFFDETERTDVYWFFQTISAEDEDDPPYYYIVNLYRFADEDGVESFVDQTVDDFLENPSDLFSDVDLLDDAESVGDQSAAISFEFERSDGNEVAAIQYLVRVGDRVAVMELSGVPAPPLSAIEILAEGQADCLEAGACEEWAPVPAGLGDDESDGGDAREEEAEIRLREVDDSGVRGTALLVADGDETEATIELRGGEEGMLVVVQGGTCDDLDPRPVSDLAEVDDDGEATLTIDAALDELLDDDHAIAVYAGEDDLDEPPVACGETGG